MIGNLFSSDPSNMAFELRVSLGMEEGMSIVDKFGSNPDIDTATVPEYLWPLGGDYAWGNDLGETLYISSSSILDNQEIEISVLTVDTNGNWNEEIFTVTLQGQTKVAVITPSGDPVVRCFRMQNEANFGNDVSGDVYAYYDDTVDAGVPQTLSKTLAMIPMLTNQTKQLMYTIPSGYWGFLWRGEAGTTKSSVASECDFVYISRRLGKVFKEKKDFGVMTSGSNNYVDVRPFPDILPEKTDLAIKSYSVSANNMSAWGSFHILLITNARFNQLRGM